MAAEGVCTVIVLVADDEQCTNANFGCSHYCMQTPFGARCVCPHGMELSGSKTCIGQLLITFLFAYKWKNNHYYSKFACCFYQFYHTSYHKPTEEMLVSYGGNKKDVL